MPISLDVLTEAVAGSGVGLRARTSLMPLGGAGDKVAPPTYGVPDGAETRYATETRRIDGQDVPAVVLDSVASQANRFEQALLEAYRRGRMSLPVTSIDFRSSPGAEHLGLLSDLELSHRIFDAALRESLLDGVLFRLSPVGRAITEATSRNATSLYHHAPGSLLFGAWDSTGPKGGKGAKYERAITSEIVGYGATTGVRTASRLDPTGVELKAGPLYEAKAGNWTLDAAEAVLDKGKPKPYARPGASGDRGRPSQANLGNITPSIDGRAGGVTVDRIVSTTVLSFVQLRRLRFLATPDGSTIPAHLHRQVETAARTALAALGLAAAVLAFEEGLDLRSRCVLVADQPLAFELISSPGKAGITFSLTDEEAMSLVAEARARAEEAGMTWRPDELLLRPADRLVDLIRKSNELAATGETLDEAGQAITA